MTTPATISRWFDRGVAQKATHMIVVCDTFSYDDYPVYVMPDEDVREKVEEYRAMSMQTIMEVYDLRMDKDLQLSATRVFNY